MADMCKLEVALFLFLMSLPLHAADKYTVTARLEMLRPTLSYQSTFSMSIVRRGDVYVIDSLHGFASPSEEQGRAYDGGLTLSDNGDGSYTVVTTGHNLLYEYTGEQALEQATVEDKYYLYLVDESGRYESHEWKLRLNDDGTIAIGDFYIAHVSRTTRHARHWRDSVRQMVTVEAYYHDAVARKDTIGGSGTAGIATVTVGANDGTLSCRVLGNAVRVHGLDAGERVSLYSVNGIMVATATGNADGCASLPLHAKGVFILHRPKKQCRLKVRL